MNQAEQPLPVAPPPWYRQFWPWLLITIPLATVIAGVATIWIASREPVALVHDDYYKEGLAINQNLARDREAASAHMRALLQVDTSSGLLSGQLFSDQALDDITVLFIHPVASQYDQRHQVAVNSDGHFTVALPDSAQRWYLELRGDHDPGWRLQGDVELARSGTTELLSQARLVSEHPTLPGPAVTEP